MKLNKAQSEVFNAIADIDDIGTFTPHHVAELVGKTYNAVRRHFPALVEAGLIEKVGKGVYALVEPEQKPAKAEKPAKAKSTAHRGATKGSTKMRTDNVAASDTLSDLCDELQGHDGYDARIAACGRVAVRGLKALTYIGMVKGGGYRVTTYHGANIDAVHALLPEGYVVGSGATRVVLNSEAAVKKLLKKLS